MGETKRGKGAKAIMGKKGETKMVKEEENNEKEKEEEETTPIRSIFCLKNRSETEMKKREEIDDCFILDFNPFLSLSHRLSVLSLADDDDDDDDDLSVIAVRGQVACRDYPHSRHLCVKFPFETTPHETCCELCYCYVCDSPAPCNYWTNLDSSHCHASERVGDWKFLRNSWKNQPQP